MMVHLGKIEVFKGHMAQPFERPIGQKFSLAHLGQQFLERLGVHCFELIILPTCGGSAGNALLCFAFRSSK